MIYVIRSAVQLDRENVYRWRTDPKVMRGSLHPERFTKQKHQDWFDSRIALDLLYIVEDEKGPFGVISFDSTLDPDWSFYVLADRQGEGLGQIVTRLGLALAGTKFRTVYAKVLKTNERSLELHKKLGFRFLESYEQYVELFKDL